VALEYLKLGINKEWLSSNELNNYMLKYSIVVGNNDIYYDFLKMMIGWIQVVIDAFPEEQFDEKLLEIANGYLIKTIPKVTFPNINIMLKDKFYTDIRYIDLYGNVAIYFYIEKDIIHVDVMHQFCDKNGELMQKRNKNMGKEFDWYRYNPQYQYPGYTKDTMMSYINSASKVT
jgi:hypothetical protein